MVRNKDLSLCSITEIKNELKRQNIIGDKRITIRKLSQTINTNTYILTFNNPKPPVEKYIPNPWRCYNCQKYGLLKEVCSRKPVWVKCGTHEPDHTEKTYSNNLNYNNCYESHRVDSKQCKIWEKEREILKIKVTKNITFSKARRLVEMPFIKPTFAKITKTPPNENRINTQIKKKNWRRIDKPNKLTTKLY